MNAVNNKNKREKQIELGVSRKSVLNYTEPKNKDISMNFYNFVIYNET